jgi:ABC-type antimicrobial peptide transport system permease subunit
LINESLAHRYFPNQDPIGQRTDRGTIIGVVGDVRQSGLDRPATPEIYYSFAQNAAATSDAGVSLVIRAGMRPEALVATVRDAVHQVNPNQVLFNIETMSRVIAESFAGANLYLWLVGLFSAIAVLLAIAGTYGVLSYAVTGRTHEFAIRLALGANRRQILNIVLAHGSMLIAIGLAVGAAGALTVTRALETLVESVTSPDAVTLAAVGTLLTVVALAACLAPAYRATRVDPNTALKSD